ncbi:hypothetical protein A0257_01840 [Hymenobacter psoromatis]|nr:hypothetical protein A0257_01840 [Hymenobacter psoromatis]
MALNALLLLLAGGLAYSLVTPDAVSGKPHPKDIAYVLFFTAVLLAGPDVFAILVAALLHKPQWINGFALAGLLVFLIGLGSCGYML